MTLSRLATVVLLSLSAATVRAAAGDPAPGLLEVDAEGTLVYQEPSTAAPVMRRLYLGELVKPVERLADERGNDWIKIQLGGDASGFVPASRLVRAGPLPVGHWRPQRVVRDERPVGVALRGLGESLGATLNVRYLPLTRLGITLGIGAVIDGASMRGRTYTFGLISHPWLGRLSPFIEAGLTNLAYSDGPSTLNVLATYLTGGLELMTDWGLYLGVGACFIRSVAVDVSYSWNDAHAGTTQPGAFGRLGRMMDRDVFHGIEPSLTLGYGF